MQYALENPVLFLSTRRPGAVAHIRGSEDHPQLRGTAAFYPAAGGVFVVTQVCGLPWSQAACGKDIFAMHIHSGAPCAGTSEDPFADTGMHYNPKDCPHPAHAGDLPPLFSNRGYAFCAVFTNRFTLEQVRGRTVILHAMPDDFTSQPAGNAGKKIACGVIR